MTSTLTGKDCGCGKADHAGACELRSLTRPKFFCGQLLTDEDLAALVTWVVDRRRLDRLRAGWGVVCGLDVGAEPTMTGHVAVAPGHAVTSCGDDIVVPVASIVDLTSACPDAGNCGADPPPDTFVLDIGVEYRERGDVPVLALGRSACGEAGECEDSRIVESYGLITRAVVAGSVPDRPEWTRWQEGLDEAISLLAQAKQDGLPGNVTPEHLRDWLGNRIRERPPTHFRFVADWLRGAKGLDRPKFLEALFWLTQDRVLAFLGDCPTAHESTPVWLARVWLARREASWVVQAVDPGSPYRREFGPGTWPAPVGRLNIARVLWHRPDEACVELRKLGVQVAGTSEWRPAEASDVDDLREMFTRYLTVACDDTVCLRYVTPPEGAQLTEDRVVGFVCPDIGEKPDAEPKGAKRPRATARVRPAPKPALKQPRTS